MLATLHAAGTFLLGTVLLLGTSPHRVVYVVSYLIGAEVLWRMAGARVPWEFGEYAAIALLGGAIVRLGVRPRTAGPPVTYFLLLLPSVWLTLAQRDASAARGEVSFNLAGPFLLTVACIFFDRVSVSAFDIRGAALAMLAPTISVAMLIGWRTYFLASATFGQGSNFESSGGFGPNQVSAALGLGAMVALGCAAAGGQVLLSRMLFFAIALLLWAQSALTFSRGGLYGSLLACIIAGICMLGQRRHRRRAAVAGVLVVAGVWYLLPRLETFTSGALGRRLESTDPTLRDQLVVTDLQVWMKNFVWGLGPGGSSAYHVEGTAAHTEYTRLLAEHGALGLVALCLLALIVLQRYKAAWPRDRRALAAALLTWSLLFMMHSATRIAALTVPDRRSGRLARRGRRDASTPRQFHEGAPGVRPSSAPSPWRQRSSAGRYLGDDEDIEGRAR